MAGGTVESEKSLQEDRRHVADLADVVVDPDGNRPIDPHVAVDDPDLEGRDGQAPGPAEGARQRTVGPSPLKVPRGEDHSKVRRSTAVSASVTVGAEDDFLAGIGQVRRFSPPGALGGQPGDDRGGVRCAGGGAGGGGVTTGGCG